MKIAVVVNGKQSQIESGTTIQGLLNQRKIRPEVVVVEVNDQIVPRTRYDEVVLNDGDRIELVFYMGGGQSVSTFSRANLYSNILELIGDTPMVRLNRIVQKDMAEIYAKVEFFNPGGSVKDRICIAMIEAAEREGLLHPGSTVIEPTSGNTGIGLAMICAAKGYKCILTMPETMSLERIYILKTFGAQVVLTPGIEGMKGAIDKALELASTIPDSFIPEQFDNPVNPEIHRKTTALEVLTAVGRELDAFVAGVGTGGTITGVGEILKKELPNVRIIAVEPRGSPFLSEGRAGPHKIQGIGAGFLPSVLNTKVIDEVIKVDDKDAFETSKQLARLEGLFVGISSGAAVWAALQVAKQMGSGRRIVTVLPDTGERYFSIEQYFQV